MLKLLNKFLSRNLPLILTVIIIVVTGFAWLVLENYETAIAAAPSVEDYQQSNWTDTTGSSEVTGTLTWQAGDLIIVVGATAEGPATLGTPTATGLTFSLVQETNAGASNQDVRTYLWSATAAGSGSSAVTSTIGGGTNTRGISAFVYRGSDGLGNNSTINNSSAKVISLTRSEDNSSVVVILADWNAVDDTTVSPSPGGGTQRVAQNVSGATTSFIFNWGDQGTAGTTSYGITDHTGTVDMGGIVVEVLGQDAPAEPSTEPHVKVRGGGSNSEGVKVRGGADSGGVIFR